MVKPGWGWGSTYSMSLGTDLETTAPPPLFFFSFGHGQSLVLPPTNLQPILFMEAQGQALQIASYR